MNYSEASYASLEPLEPAPKHYDERSGVVLLKFENTILKYETQRMLFFLPISYRLAINSGKCHIRIRGLLCNIQVTLVVQSSIWQSFYECRQILALSASSAVYN